MSHSVYTTQLKQAQRRMDDNVKLKNNIVSGLNLEVAPEAISDNQALFGRGLGMDSLDTLEIVVMVEDEFGVTINDSHPEAFGSVNGMVDFIHAERARRTR